MTRRLLISVLFGLLLIGFTSLTSAEKSTSQKSGLDLKIHVASEEYGKNDILPLRVQVKNNRSTSIHNIRYDGCEEGLTVTLENTGTGDTYKLQEHDSPAACTAAVYFTEVRAGDRFNVAEEYNLPSDIQSGDYRLIVTFPFAPKDSLDNKDSLTTEVPITITDNSFEHYKFLSPIRDVVQNKTWTITLNTEVDPQSVSTDSVFVKKANCSFNEDCTRKLNTQIKVSSDGKSIIVEAPKMSSDTPSINGYTLGETYAIYVTQLVTAKSGESIENRVKMHFTIEDGEYAR